MKVGIVEGGMVCGREDNWAMEKEAWNLGSLFRP